MLHYTIYLFKNMPQFNFIAHLRNCKNKLLHAIQTHTQIYFADVSHRILRGYSNLFSSTLPKVRKDPT